MNGTAIYRSRFTGRRGGGTAGSLASIAAGRRRMRKLIVALLIAASAAHSQSIELRKIRTLVDPTGNAFNQAPYQAAALPGGRYMLQETNVVPVVVDSTGRLVKRFVRGGGPGEFDHWASSLAVIRDTLYAGNGESYNVYGPDLKFVRAF